MTDGFVWKVRDANQIFAYVENTGEGLECIEIENQ